MSEEESKAIYRLNFHKEGAGIGSGMIIVNKADVETVLNMLEKKDKLINEMVSFIAEKDIEEDICEKVANYDCDKMDFGVCENCIIKYFERKVEND